MTKQQFEELEKKVYYPDKQWEDLIEKFNKKNDTHFHLSRRSTYVFILKAIAEKHGWPYKGAEYQRFSPLKKLFT